MPRSNNALQDSAALFIGDFLGDAAAESQLITPLRIRAGVSIFP